MRDILSGDEIRSFNTINQANGFIKTLTSNTFVFWLSFFPKVMPHVEIFFESLQKADINPLTAENYISSFVNNVQTIREEIDEESIETEPDPPTKKKEMSRQ